MSSQKKHPSVDSDPSPTHLLLENPRKWTPAHVQAANVKLIPHVPAGKLVDSRYFPKDGDEGFERSVQLFSKSVFDQGCTANREDRLRFGRILSIFEEVLEVPVPSHLHPHIEFLQSIIEEARLLIKGGWKLSVRQSSKFSLDIPRLSICNILRADGAIVKMDSPCSRVRKDRPLAILSIIRENRLFKDAQHVVPQILFQGARAYTENPHLEQYDVYVITLDHTILHVYRGTMPAAYLKDLFQGKRPEPLELYRSREFDLSEAEGRRQSFRVIMALLRYLLGSNGLVQPEQVN